MTEEELVVTIGALPGVVTTTATEEAGAPEVAWGDSFFFYDPGDVTPADRRMPFATVVVSDYPGFDTASDLDRPGVFRLNVAVGRAGFEELLGFPPGGFADRADAIDFAELDRVIPHPVYAVQGWVSVLCPAERTEERVLSLIDAAHRRARDRYRPPR